jgi:hypothetical protein
MNLYKYIFLVLLVILVGILQSTTVLNLYGIKPNLLLIVLIAASFFVSDTLIYLSLVFLGMIMLSFKGGFELEQLVLGILSIASFFAGQRLHWQPFLMNLFFIGIGTIIFYFMISPAFIFNNSLLVSGEVIYNLALSAIFFKLFSAWLTTNSMLRT